MAPTIAPSVGGRAARAAEVAAEAAYPDTILADSPLAYWRLSEATGTTVNDSSSSGTFSGTYINTPTLGQTGIPGAVNNMAVNFDSPAGTTAGNQQAATFGDVLPLTGTKLTIEFWMKPSSTGSFSPYIARGDVTWRVTTTGTTGVNTLQFSVGSGSTPALSVTGLSLDDGNWHHIVCVYDQTNLLIYVDAVQVASKAWTTDVPASTGKTVGIGYNSDQTGRWIHAVMDEVAIYNTALSSTRITAHYNAGIAS